MHVVKTQLACETASHVMHISIQLDNGSEAGALLCKQFPPESFKYRQQQNDPPNTLKDLEKLTRLGWCFVYVVGRIFFALQRNNGNSFGNPLAGIPNLNRALNREHNYNDYVSHSNHMCIQLIYL